MLHPLTKWDFHWIDVAKLTARMSKDPSTKVGAVIAKDKRMLGAGFNGFPPQIEDNREWLNDRPTKYKLVIHAEMNAILEAYKNGHHYEIPGSTLYVTLAPCADCAKIITAVGIKRVIWAGGADHVCNHESRYSMQINDCKFIFEKAGVAFHVF